MEDGFNFDTLWLNNSTYGKWIIVFILVVFFRALASAVYHSIRYRTGEARWLDTAIFNLNDQKEGQGQPAKEGETEKGKTAPPPVEIDRILEAVPTDSIIGHRLIAIKKMMSAIVRINVITLQQMTLAREEQRRSLRFPQMAVGLSMMLGLLGTIIGLSMMVQSLGAVLPEAVEKGDLREVLGPLKTAFSTTLVGLVSSIFSAFLNYSLKGAQSRFFEKLERFTIEELLPAVVPSLEGTTVLEKINIEMRESFGVLQKVSEQNREALEKFSAAEREVGIVLANVEQATRQVSAASAQNVVGQLTSVIHEVKRSNASIGTLNNKLSQMIADMERINRDTLNKIRNSRSEMDTYQSSIEQGFRSKLLTILLHLHISALLPIPLSFLSPLPPCFLSSSVVFTRSP